MTAAEALPITEGVWIEIIGTLGVVIVAALGTLSVILGKQNKTLRTVRNHVENSHIDRSTGQPYNLRDNIDDNQNELLREIRGLRIELGRVDQRVIAVDQRVASVDSDLRTVRTEFHEHIEWSRDQEDRVDSHDDRINNQGARLGVLENTIDPKGHSNES